MDIDYFAENGLLAKTIPGFAPRQAQVHMADAVSKTIKSAGRLLVEAGTGTGKTFAYLVPALDSGKRVIISTGSKALQDQLYERDLPTLLLAMQYGKPVAQLKGRSNYLCTYRLALLEQEMHFLAADVFADLPKVRNFKARTLSGDVADIPGLQEQAPILPFVTSTNDNCLGRECPDYETCFLVKARRKALDAQVVVINHHLFFADMSVKDTGFGELLPDADVYIFDEAHQLPDIASQYFGESLSSRQLSDVAEELRLAYRLEAKDMAQLGKAADRLIQDCQAMRLSFGVEPSRGNLRDILAQPAMQRDLQRLKETIKFCYDVCKLALGRGEQINNCFERLTGFLTAADHVTAITEVGAAYWYETTKRHFTLNVTPLSIAERFAQEVMRVGCSWIFTSATLTVGEEFNYFSQRMGVEDADTCLLDSPFDYEHQSLLCVPRNLPDTSNYQRATQLAERLLPVIEQVPGGCFFLCTSYNSVNQIAQVLRDKLDRTVLVQGDDNKQRILADFVADGHAVLVATSSFWEGVDVRGAALSCVIIDKLPFTSPDEPLLKARMEDCRLQGGDPFQQLQLPEAVIVLKQGVGRLIRDYQDRGILILCDPRLVNKPYGAAFLKSLPPIPRCRDLTRLSEFWTIPDMPVVEPAALLQPALLQEETITDENSGD